MGLVVRILKGKDAYFFFSNNSTIENCLLNMENQTETALANHKSVLLDHEMTVDGVKLRERKELQNMTDEETSEEKSILIHTRFIDGKKYEVQQVSVKDEIIEEIIDPDLNDDEIKQFKEEWEEKWKPSIGQQSGGIQQFICLNNNKYV